jgi:hypothetical protein
MDRLETKSLGAIIDEYLTSNLKVKANPSEENIARNKALNSILDKEIGASWGAITVLVAMLDYQLKACWEAQEKVMHYKRVGLDNLNPSELYMLAGAAIRAQETNAERCKLVREIDKVLGESDRTYLEKTYA